MTIQNLSALNVAAGAFGTIFIGFGINALVRPENALSFYEVKAESQAVSVLTAVYGIRDIFMGVAIHAALALRSRKTLGWILMAASAVAFADGLICRVYVGAGEMNHWGYAPLVGLVGVLLAINCNLDIMNKNRDVISRFHKNLST